MRKLLAHDHNWGIVYQERCRRCYLQGTLTTWSIVVQTVTENDERQLRLAYGL